MRILHCPERGKQHRQHDASTRRGIGRDSHRGRGDVTTATKGRARATGHTIVVVVVVYPPQSLY